ncbi:hypothetical protein TraAM80_07870 [Trypanosoma rangeli]|uniref:Uncharacterized protein n=1 Tax=Trypanosoma rangeli TaxID=5698 RepID=A0A422N3F8_TRYRA|nr:uncharacterized protein TraAM80_07870 [Trypanosoma rangeli]RNF00005.1 hypothetical protein TraAM80_07870 [Trypanosoma rangeli]|eukprot:RNF00005.1 hypothetical protein TraAM80_07870 [Trypanosoma rangeli]
MEKGEILWSECLFVFGVAAAGGTSLILTGDMEWNKTASTVWNAMVSKGGEKVTVWAVGFSALSRALLVASHRPTIANLLVEPQPISPRSDIVVLSLSTLLVKSYEKLKGASPLTPIQAAWLLIAMQEGSMSLHDPSETRMTWLSCFLPFSQRATRVPLKAAANAFLFIDSVTRAGEVKVCCSALKTIPAETQVRLHLGTSFDAAVCVEDGLKLQWENYCRSTECLVLGVL